MRQLAAASGNKAVLPPEASQAVLQRGLQSMRLVTYPEEAALSLNGLDAHPIDG